MRAVTGRIAVRKVRPGSAAIKAGCKFQPTWRPVTLHGAHPRSTVGYWAQQPSGPQQEIEQLTSGSRGRVPLPIISPAHECGADCVTNLQADASVLLASGRNKAVSDSAQQFDTLLLYLYADTDRHYRRNLEFFVERGVMQSSSTARVKYVIVVQSKVRRLHCNQSDVVLTVDKAATAACCVAWSANVSEPHQG